METTNQTQGKHEHYWKDRPVKSGEWFPFTGKGGGRVYPNAGTMVRECVMCGERHLIGAR